jgi:hypothetical protein
MNINIEVSMKHYFFHILVLIPCIAYAQSEPYRILDVKPNGAMYIITYENLPVGDDPDAEYKVALSLTREQDRKFSMDLRELSGDVGVGKFTGSNLTIHWNYGKQFPKGMPFDDVEFKLTITKKTGIPSWVWYGGGAIAIGAGAYFLLQPKTDETTSDIPLPNPPGGRPPIGNF